MPNAYLWIDGIFMARKIKYILIASLQFHSYMLLCCSTYRIKLIFIFNALVYFWEMLQF